MDTQEIRALLGKSIFERAQKYRKRILQSSCTTNEDGVRHLTALVQGSGPDCYYTQVWLRENGTLRSDISINARSIDDETRSVLRRFAAQYRCISFTEE